MVRERGVELDMAVAADGDGVELDLLVVDADGIGREDVQVAVVARVTLATPGTAQGRAV